MPPAFEATAAFPELASAAGRDSASVSQGVLRRLLRAFEGLPAEAIDRSTGLYNRAGLLRAAQGSFARHGGSATASAIVLEFSELVEVREIYGASVARKVVAKVVRRVRKLAGFRGFAGRTGPSQFTVVLVGVPAAKALLRLQRVLGKPARVEFDAGDSEIVLVPEFAVDEIEPGGSVPSLCRDIARELARSQKDERRRLDYLTSERERHSRPMSIRG